MEDQVPFAVFDEFFLAGFWNTLGAYKFPIFEEF